VRRVDVLKLRRRVVPAFGARDQMLRGLTQDRFIDWPRSQAFAFSGGHFANVYLNRRDRFVHGSVPAEQVDRLCEDIAAALLKWSHPVTGQTLIERVYRREEVYSGPQLALLPDLIVRPRAGYIFETRFKRGWLTGPLPADLTGVHRMEGIFIGAGPRFKNSVEMGSAALIDVPATLLYLCETPVPQEMDGRVLTDFLRPDYVAAHTVIANQSAMSAEPNHGNLAYTAEEEQIIMEHLSKLGYL
jgi:predicted AlkP superfamily phosphohydrolase/phosphomutase